GRARRRCWRPPRRRSRASRPRCAARSVRPGATFRRRARLRRPVRPRSAFAARVLRAAASRVRPGASDRSPLALQSAPMNRIRNWLLTGLLVLAPAAITLTVFYRLLNWVDNLLGRYMRFAAFDYHRIPGLGLLATLVIL